MSLWVRVVVLPEGGRVVGVTTEQPFHFSGEYAFLKGTKSQDEQTFERDNRHLTDLLHHDQHTKAVRDVLLVAVAPVSLWRHAVAVRLRPTRADMRHVFRSVVARPTVLVVVEIRAHHRKRCVVLGIRHPTPRLHPPGRRGSGSTRECAERRTAGSLLAAVVTSSLSK